MWARICRTDYFRRSVYHGQPSAEDHGRLLIRCNPVVIGLNWWLVWRGELVTALVTSIKLRRAWLVLGLVTTFGGSTIRVYLSDHSGPLSLATPPWVGAMSTGDCFGQSLGRNGEFCLAVRPATSTSSVHICRLYNVGAQPVANTEILNREGAKDIVSALSSCVANAHNEL